VLDVLLAKAQNSYVIPRSLIIGYLGLGASDNVFSLLESAFERRDGVLWWLRAHPIFDPVRSDPRFDTLLDRMGFPSE
jgi:hypothetical protein